MRAGTSEWLKDPNPRCLVLEDYQGPQPRWCPGCGDLAVLNAAQRLCREEQLPPEKTVFVSGIGCSSRFPHYMKTYGFHGLHGRAFPVACGIKSRRPDLNVFVATGDGDCCSIGAGHWIHGLRYNMDITVMVFDNNIYGLTKKQTSPTTPKGHTSNTHPKGSFLSPLNPLTVSLGIQNTSFIAQVVDWNPPLLYAVLQAAYRHKGTGFIRILQRCPHFTADNFKPLQNDPSKILLLKHERGIDAGAAVDRMFPNKMEHDPSNRLEALALAMREDVVPVGLLYCNPETERYDQFTIQGLEMSVSDKMKALNQQLDRFQI